MSPVKTWIPTGGGEMGQLIRDHDWSRTPVGDFAEWPQSLRTALGILLDSGYAMYIGWGPEFTQFYNDAYRPILGATKHPAALGISTRETFAEIWDFIRPLFDRVMEQGQSTTLVNQMLPLHRNGYLEECYFTFSYSAIRNEDSQVGGVMVTCIETTQTVLDERRLRSLGELSTHSSEVRNLADARSRVERTLRGNPQDVPFVELVPRGPETPLTGEAMRIDDLERHRGRVESPAWAGEAVREGILLPLPQAGSEEVAEFLLMGISPRLGLDSSYESYLQMLAKQTAVVLDNARAYEMERRRAEALEELDRAKTTFFSNVSHEFRTPLTLLLAPLDDVLARNEGVSEELRQSLEMAQRNGHRLLKLVNTLLEFSRIEAGRVRAVREPVDLAQFTADVASAFRSTVANAGLRFEVQCEPLPAAVYVDREMWEKVVLNLISNAFKYTFEGSITVSLRPDGERVVLEVADTGIGIPARELPHIFDRFHRVEGARGRTFEGTGIGLSLVSELVRFHDGEVAATSEEGKGSAFRVYLPYGGETAENAKGLEASHTLARDTSAFVEEAGRWVDGSSLPAAAGTQGRVLFADDNADVREYVTRVLSDRFTVQCAANGEDALAAIPVFRPDIVLSDVMMPRLNGYQLLAAMREREEMRNIPLIMLSARAGEEARIEGLESGASDYLVKPFSARELLARVTSQVTIAHLRREALEAERRFRDLLMQAPAAIALLGGPDHVFELANNSYLRLVGRARETDLIGKRVIDLFPEVESQGFIALLDGVYRNSEPYVGRELALSLELPDGTRNRLFLNFIYQPVKNREGVTEGILFHGSDVTDLVNARTLIEDSERQFRTLAESIPQLVWTCQPDGRCDFLSKQWLIYTGIPEAEQLGLQWLERVMNPEDRERTYDAWMAAVEDRQPYDIEFRLRRFDGSYRWFKTRGTPVRNAAGGIEKWFGTCTDIEDQKLAERHMLDQQKLESVGLLAGGIAHDFNNLLVGVLGNASLIEESLPVDHPLAPMVKGIVEAGERAAHLTRQMLAYAGKGRMYVERVDLHSLVRSTASLVEASLPKSVRMILESDSRALTIEGDSGQIQQVIMNLAINGGEAMGVGNSGTLWIRTGPTVVDRNYLATHRFVGDAPLAGTYACLEVQDTGHGIDPATMTKIFDPFFTTKFTGRGLGLAAVLGIVRSAHGGLEVLSTVGQGTTFRVLIPLIEEAADAEEPPEASSGEQAAHLPSVLVIDDEDMVLQTTRATLRKAGYSVLLAMSGDQGLEIFSQRRAEIRLVLLDMSMPGMSGKEVLESIRQQDERVPVLIFSGYSEAQVHNHFAGLEISGFIQKPFTSHKLASAVHALLPDAKAI